MDRVAPTERHKHVHEGRTVYEWEQRIGEVTVYAELPKGVRAKQLEVEITTHHLRIGIKGLPPYIDHELGGAVSVSDSVWTVEDGVLVVNLAKKAEAAVWEAALRGHEGDADADAERRRLVLERFQKENPGFDFSGAQFNGEVPDPQTFLRDL